MSSISIACFSDMHIQNSMLDYPVTLRQTLVSAADRYESENGADVVLVGGDTISDYPDWNRSSRLPYKNYLDAKEKLAAELSRASKDKKVLYVAGNHDYALGETAAEGGKPYNSCDFYFTGPMKNDVGTLAERDMHVSFSQKLGRDGGEYLLGWHYVIKGVDFFGISPHPDDMYSSQGSGFDDVTVEWLGQRLAEIDPDGDRWIFVVGHFPIVCNRSGRPVSFISQYEKLHKALLPHKNLFYMYGHVHAEDFFVRKNTASAFDFFAPDGSVIGPGSDAASTREMGLDRCGRAYSTFYMGALRCDNEPGKKLFMDDAIEGWGGLYDKKRQYILTGTPRIAQSMSVRLSEEKAVFQMLNFGSYPSFTTEDKISEFTVFKK